MKLQLDQQELCARLAPLLERPEFERGVRSLAADPFFVAHFLVSVSQGEGLGEAAVAMIGQEELAALIQGLAKQLEEERGHKEQTIEVARELFPQWFDGDDYRFEGSLDGRPYYLAILEGNRARLKRKDRYSRLCLYLTTTFGYEIMVVLLYSAIADAVAGSPLEPRIRSRVERVLRSILAEEETHLGVLDQHAALLAADRASLSDAARRMLDVLDRLELEDYEAPARDAVEQVVAMMSRYGDASARRAEIERGAS